MEDMTELSYDNDASDEDKMSLVYKKYTPHVAKNCYVWNIKKPEDVEEVIQAVMMKVWETRSTLFHPPAEIKSPGAWITGNMMTIIKQETLDYLGLYKNKKGEARQSARGLRRKLEIPYLTKAETAADKEYYDRLLGVSSSAEDDFFGSLEVSTEDFWKEVDKLSERQCEVIYMRYKFEYGHKETEAKLGLSARQVDTAIAKGIEQLRLRLNPGQESYPTAHLPRATYELSTHCVNGHEFTEENTTYNRKKGAPRATRRCKACQNASLARYQAKLASKK